RDGGAMRALDLAVAAALTVAALALAAGPWSVTARRRLPTLLPLALAAVALAALLAGQATAMTAAWPVLALVVLRLRADLLGDPRRGPLLAATVVLVALGGLLGERLGPEG